ncbi:hypothetical protein NOC27_493 [Nitrosococcus oceani AFC27]|nr:hypothetical protein [Nitrosococcus oceani]EDZ67166.1 hypothetical protein NOC27_493 [Nitrosococcus oceani AFC27]
MKKVIHNDFQNPTFRKHMDDYLALNETLGDSHLRMGISKRCID